MAKIYIFGGSKGGVGKTTACLALVITKELAGEPCQVRDGDVTNPDVIRTLALPPESHGFNPADIADWRDVLAAATDTQNLIINLPGGGDAVLLEYAEVISESLTAEGHNLYFISTLNRGAESLSLLKTSLAVLEGTAIKPVVILNEYFGEAIKFARYKKSKTREALKKMNGVEIVMPELADFSIDALLSPGRRDLESADNMTKNIYQKWLGQMAQRFTI